MSGAGFIFAIEVFAVPTATAHGVALPTTVPSSSVAAATPLETLNQHDRAVHCLAAAISYEAGNEPIEGQEAVAQVVLNRLQDPAYPKSVCGVVFQGSTRRTGCQFTFTCDGSLRRARSLASMARANAVAERALRGNLSSIVGNALNYHADYVSPYWAPRLIRVAKIGAHIFYRPPSFGESLRLSPLSFGGIEDDSRLPAFSSAAVMQPSVFQPSIVQPSMVGRLKSGVVFTPWGLQTLAISKSGKIKAITPSRATGF